jgi:hypothetical protein
MEDVSTDSLALDNLEEPDNLDDPSEDISEISEDISEESIYEPNVQSSPSILQSSFRTKRKTKPGNSWVWLHASKVCI